MVAELVAHDGESTTPRKAQHKLGKVVNKIQLEKFMESLEHLPEEAVPPTTDDPIGGTEAKTQPWRGYGVRKDKGRTLFSEQCPPTELAMSSSTPRGELWESKSSWRNAAPGAIEAG